MQALQRTKNARQSGDANNLGNRLPMRLWVEAALGLISATLLTLTLLAPRWIELLFGTAPDAGNGSAEWGLALSLAACSVVMFGFAGRTWRKHTQLLRTA